ncbi:MAG: N-acetylmuramoyl-L-alanine amidase [Alphaproteobacteria bacterium]|nr:N-acetylmuramoyl-L-alanine amidase [Alphaproteobacteria bacterium]
MRLLNRLIFGVFVFCCFAYLFATQAFAGVRIYNMRLGNQPDGARVVFDMNGKVNYRVFLLDSPKRVVVDLDDSDIEKLQTRASNQVVSGARLGKLEGNDKRVVMDLSQPAVVKKTFVMAPQEGQNWRLVIDLMSTSAENFRAQLSDKYTQKGEQKITQAPIKSEKAPAVKETPVATTFVPAARSGRKRIIVLDPGHGGKDPGAIGSYAKTYEKNVTLAMGKELQAILQNKGYAVYLTRDNDIFIPLRQRIKIAQQRKADLFMSIHADSAQNRNATGLSVYTLSDTASDQEAAALAERENKADIIGGIDLGGNTKEVNDILISLSQTDTRNKSSKYATYLVQEMSKSVKLVRNTHRFAGFAVLKAPDVPAALLEMGYLSNRTEEANLKTPAYRKKLAEATARAIDRYFKDPEIASNW